MTQRTLVLGGPGAGKTTRLLAEMEAALDRGVSPDRVAFVAYTNAAADEARERAKKKFGLTDRDLPYFRTCHSLAFRELGLSRSDVLTDAHLAELSDLTGELITGDDATDGPAAGRSADPLLTLDHYARTTGVGLRAAWEEHGGSVDWFRLKRFSDAYRTYREERFLRDFTDMLTDYVAADWLKPVPADLAIVDEGQDLTRAQWRAVNKAFAAAPRLFVAGDDRQSIHRWAGAADDVFLSLPYDREVLPRSHRLPREIFDLSEEIAGRLTTTYARSWEAAPRSGTVAWVARPDEVDLSVGTWLLLARTRHQLRSWVEAARDQGVVYRVKGEPSVDPAHAAAIVAYEALRAGKRVEPVAAESVLRALGASVPALDAARTYAWENLLPAAGRNLLWHDALVRIPRDDREYYLACRRRGESLTAAPRLRVETIHGAKGLEAENVALLTDLTWKTKRGFELDPDSEHRVFYVGTTRASSKLVLVAPQTAYGYAI